MTTGEPGAQPEYTQAPRYGAPQYRTAPYGGYGPPSQPTRAGGQSFGVIGAVIVVVGAILGIVAFTATNWFDGHEDSHFSDVHNAVQVLDRYKVANGVSVAYFGWLAWVLLAAAVVFALIANIPSTAGAAFRVIGPLVAAAGLAFTFLAIRLATKSDSNSYGDYLKHARVAFYLALAGFLLAGVGAALGPRRA